MRWIFLLFIAAICALLSDMMEQISDVASHVKFRAVCQADFDPDACGGHNVRQPR